MSWLLFIDESGHDHKNMPLEVRGGIALHISKLFDFIRDWEKAIKHCFGGITHKHKEIKGHRLLDKDRFKWAALQKDLSQKDRWEGIKKFLANDGAGNGDFAAYGQASLLMAHCIFRLLKKHEAKVFACAIPKGAKAPQNFDLTETKNFLRKDHVFLFQRFFYFLEEKQEHGLIIMDESEKQNDRRFVARVTDYFTKSRPGRDMCKWIVPAPLFVASDMAVGVQAADVCIYCINWGFRPNNWNYEARGEISEYCRRYISQLRHDTENEEYRSHSIVQVTDPYTSRTQ